MSGAGEFRVTSVERLRRRRENDFFGQIKFNSDGLIPAIIQEQSTGRVLHDGLDEQESSETDG